MSKKLTAEENAITFLHRKFSLKPTERIADEVGTEINLQYVFEAMEGVLECVS